ncbi:MAG: hypothetical protein WCJ30_18850, partial [Deltaproteobacteria bacterium]
PDDSFASPPSAPSVEDAMDDAWAAVMLYGLLDERLRRDGLLEAVALENEFLFVLVAMERVGVGIDRRALSRLWVATDRSPPRARRGAQSRRDALLERVALIRHVRFLGWLDGVMDVIGRSPDGRFHSDFGRSKCSRADLLELARHQGFRGCVVPAAGRVLVCATYSQTAADAVKLALIRLHRELPPSGAGIVFASEAEVLVEAPHATAAEVRALVERALRETVPTATSVIAEIRPTWAGEERS